MLVDDDAGEYFRAVLDYVHLNYPPLRAGSAESLRALVVNQTLADGLWRPGDEVKACVGWAPSPSSIDFEGNAWSEKALKKAKGRLEMRRRADQDDHENIQEMLGSQKAN